MVKRENLVVQGVSKVLKGKSVLQGVDLHVGHGEVVLLKGSNGSGKSTLVHLISGVYRLEEGDIWVDGVSLKKEPRRAKAAVTTAFQETLFDPLSSPLQALYMHSKFYGARWSRDQICHVLEEFGVTEPTRPIFQLSGGTKKKVELLKARLVETPLYIFDEPFAGLDESSRKQTEEWVRTRKRQGKAVLLVSHELGSYDFIDRTVQLEAGRIVPAALGKEMAKMLIEAVVKGWKEEHRAALAGCAGLQLLEVQTMEPTDQEVGDLLKSMGLDKLGKSVQVMRVEGSAAQEILKQLGGAARTVSVQQSSPFKTRLKLSAEISLAQVTHLLEEHGLEVIEVRQV